MGIEDADQLDLFRQQIEVMKTKLAENRERHFHATTRQKKSDFRNEDKRLREALAVELELAGLPQDDAHKIAQWDPYDQNAKADWFDPEYMFGIADGFDIVIGNPPYIQLQKNSGELRRRYQDADFETFASTGDIYQLFYEKGCQLLIPQRGLLCYITSNSWLKAQYGKSTRRYLAEHHTPLRLLEMGKDIFENAIVDTNILIARNDKSNEIGKAIDIDRLPNKNFPPVEDLWGELRPQGDNPWCALSATERSIMDKMKAVGTLLKEWDIAINYGIKTGYNTAFIIDNDTKERLVAEDPNSVDIIKPVLRGRDIKRYQAEWTKLWLIATFPSMRLDIDNYPAVKDWLRTFLPKLYQTGAPISNDEKQSLMQRMISLGLNPKERDLKKCRKKTSHAWFELQDTCAYYAVFAEEKLVWIELVENGRFAYDDSGIYCEATSFMMTGDCTKYLCTLLNSKLIHWFLQKTAPTSGMGTLRWKKTYVETIPIPKLSAREQYLFIELMEHILTANAIDPSADISAIEAEIDMRVYELYGLTTTEISAVEE